MSTQSKIQIGTKLKFLLVFLIFTLVTSAFNSFWSSKKFVDQINDLGQIQLPGVSNMGLVDMMHDGIRATVYRAILANKAKDPAEMKAVKEEAAEYEANIRQYISQLEKLDLAPETKKAIVPAIVRVDEYVKAAQEIVGIALSEDEDYARSALPKFDEKFDALEKELGVLGDLIRADAKASNEKGLVIEKMALKLNIIVLMFGIILLVFFAMVFKDQQKQLKLIIENLSVQSNRIGGTANKLSASAQNLLASTTRQSSAFQQSASALEEICATAGITETNSKRLEENAKISFETATNGNATIEQMLNAMSVINNSNALIMKQIEESNIQIGEIVTVIAEIENKTKVINDIVFQTKLLSFNASVEAARAGEQGKGFAVVAEEVGNLAQMSGNASKEISDMLTSSIKTVETIVNDSKTKVQSLAHDGREKVEHGIETAHQCGSALEEIVRQATSIDRLISEITVSIKEQSIGIMEVANAMGLLDQASNENTVTSRENLASAQELQDQVKKMEEAILVLSSMMTSKASS